MIGDFYFIAINCKEKEIFLFGWVNLQVFIFDTFVNYSLIAVVTRARTIFVSVVPFPVTWRREREARGSNERAAVYQKVAACRGRVITRHLTFLLQRVRRICFRIFFERTPLISLFAPNVYFRFLVSMDFIFATRNETLRCKRFKFHSHCSNLKNNE